MELLHPVHVEISESGDSLHIEAEVPEDLEARLQPQRLLE
jgi:hypothetical protein